MKTTDAPVTLHGLPLLMKTCRHVVHDVTLSILWYHQDKRFSDAPEGIYVVMHADLRMAQVERFPSYSSAYVRFLQVRNLIGNMGRVTSPE